MPLDEHFGKNMVTRRTSVPQRHPANLTTEQMRAAIPKLRRRLEQLAAFDPQTISERGDPSIEALENKIGDTLTEIMGADTIDYERFRPARLDTASMYMGRGTPIQEVQQGLVRGKERAIANIHTIIELFEEKLADKAETPWTRARRIFGDLNLHPEIEQECSKLFGDGHYAQAVETACKVLDMLVQKRCMRIDLSGTSLMRTAFSSKTPILKFNDQQNESEKSEQEGMMHLYEGAMLALRNPRAHGITQDHPERAIEYLSFISMLANSLNRTRRA
jgi:uncharacterized protein (TIGR02391 family)